MNKFLLSMAVLACSSFAASAASWTVFDITNPGTWKGDEKTGFELATDANGFSIKYAKGSYKNDLVSPDANPNSWRVYKGSEITIESVVETMKSITITFDDYTYNGTGYTGELKCSTGWTGVLSGTTYVINNAAGAMTFTGSPENNQVRITKIVVSDEPATAPTVPSAGGTLLSETNANGFDDWKIENVTKPEQISEVWIWKSYNNQYYLNGSGYDGTNKVAYACESWAISPVIEFTADAKTISFEHAAKFQTTLKDLCGIAIREEGATEWTTLTIPTWPEAGSWTFVNSGDIDVSAFAGKKVQIGIKYGSTADGADTWEIRNLNVPANVGGDEPTTPEVTTGTFRKVTTLESGMYVFVVGNQIATPAAADLAYGRMSLVDATIDADAVKCDVNYAFDVTVSGDKATIMANGKYYSMDDSHFTSFQFYTDENEYNYWTFAFDGDKVKFTNAKNTNCFICQTQGVNKDTQEPYWFTNLAPAEAPETFNLPVLYKRDLSGVAGVEADENAPVVYYNLQGVKVANPENGLYIRVQGKKASKVLFNK